VVIAILGTEPGVIAIKINADQVVTVINAPPFASKHILIPIITVVAARELHAETEHEDKSYDVKLCFHYNVH
jgi:hypothetical protein